MPRILVIDDDEQVRRLFVRALEKAGYLVDSASCGKDGLRMLAEQEFDLLVLDLSMPELDGFEVLARLKDHPKVPPVVVVSGAMGMTFLRASEYLGAAASMEKTDGPKMLVEIARTLLG